MPIVDNANLPAGVRPYIEAELHILNKRVHLHNRQRHQLISLSLLSQMSLTRSGLSDAYILFLLFLSFFLARLVSYVGASMCMSAFGCV